MNFIKAAWQGNKRLSVMFWGYFIVLPIVFTVIGFLAIVFFSQLWIFMVLAVFGIIYYIWVCWSVWQCAPNVAWKPWGYLARFVVGLFAIYYVISLFNTNF